MNHDLAVAAPHMDPLAFLASPARRTAEQVTPGTGEMIRSISALASQIVSQAVSMRTGEDFRSFRKEHFPRYMGMMMGFCQLLTASVDSQILEQLTQESLAEMEHELCQGGSFFGVEVAEQAAFTVWTLSKINQQVHLCNAKRVNFAMADVDQAFAQEYVVNIMFSRFHLDCLLLSVQSNRPLYPEVVSEIREGLRSAVNAYAWVRQGSELRNPSNDEDIVELPWDDEQEALLQESHESATCEVF